MEARLLDTPIWQLTPRQLFQLQEEWSAKLPPQQPAHFAEWLPVKEAGKILGRSDKTIYRWIEQGRIKSKIIGFVKFVNIAEEVKNKKTKRQF